MKYPKFLRKEQREGWLTTLPIYLCYCKFHQEEYEAYPAGYDKLLICPKCMKEENGVK